MSSRSRSRKRSQSIKPTNGRHASSSTALLERTPVLIPLDNEIRPILEARRANKGNRNGSPRSFSYAWDETEALGITADMRRSGPGMLSDQDRKDTLYKAYLNSVWISACVDVIAKRITSGGMVIEETEQAGGTDEEKKELHDFLHYINDDDDFLQLIRSIATDLLIYGECYMEIVKQNGKPYSLHKIDCITMNYQLDKHGNIVKYIQNMTHSTTAIEFQPDEVIRWWFPDPRASKKALSPIERIMGSIDADVHMADWVRSFFRKGARPNFWIQFEGSKDEATRFVTWLRENYTGMANAHVPLVLYDNAKLNEIGKGSVDIDFLKGREHMCKEILAGYQVPPAAVGLIESGNIGGGTGESQDKSLQFNACDPLKHLIFEKFNYRIVNRGFGIKGWRVGTKYADYRNDKDIVDVQTKRIERALTTPDEERLTMGKAPYKRGGDVPIIIMSRDAIPVERIAELAEEQRQQAKQSQQQAEAQSDLTHAQAEKIRAQLVPPVSQDNQQQQNTPPTKEEPQESAIAALERSINHIIDGNIRIIESIMSARSVSELSEDDQQRIANLMATIVKQDQLLQSMRAYDTEMQREKAQFHTHEITDKEGYNGQDKSKTQESSEEVLSNAQETAGTGSLQEDLVVGNDSAVLSIEDVAFKQATDGLACPVQSQSYNNLRENHHEEHLSQQTTNSQSSQEDAALATRENQDQSDESVHTIQTTLERDDSSDYGGSSKSIASQQKEELAGYIADLFTAMKHRTSSQQITRANAKDAYKLSEHDRTALANKLQEAYNAAYDYAYKRDLATVGLAKESFCSKFKDVAQWAKEQVDSIAATFEDMLSNFVDWLSDTVEDVAGQISDWIERYLSWKAPQIASFTWGSGVNDGTREAIDEIIVSEEVPNTQNIRVRVLPAESSNDLCKTYAGNDYSLEEYQGFDVSWPMHPNCPHYASLFVVGEE